MSGTTVRLMRSDSDEEVLPHEMSNLRSTIPQQGTKPSGINVLRLVAEHGTHQIEELTEEIDKLEKRVSELKYHREYVKRLVVVTDEFNESQKLKE